MDGSLFKIKATKAHVLTLKDRVDWFSAVYCHVQMKRQLKSSIICEILSYSIHVHAIWQIKYHEFPTPRTKDFYNHKIDSHKLKRTFPV